MQECIRAIIQAANEEIQRTAEEAVKMAVIPLIGEQIRQSVIIEGLQNEARLGTLKTILLMLASGLAGYLTGRTVDMITQ